MKPRLPVWIGLLALCAAFPSDAAEPLPPPEDGMATVKQIMLAVTIPASDAIFGAEEEALKTPEDWDGLEAAAMAVAESGRLLLTGGRKLDDKGWSEAADAMTASALLAAAAARGKDLDKVLGAGDAIYEACEACHVAYMPARLAE